jgi:tetraacyldisaccharide 4'-kinase
MFKYLRLFLFPFSIIYGFVVIIRNKLYDWGILKSVQFDLPVICVGNLVVGGSGKTPVTEYLVHLLSGYKIAILSRGYGRETRGFVKANQDATASTIGDEPMQYFRKFPDITVAVCEDRVAGIKKLKEQHDVIILDDSYQHRAVTPGFSVLLFEYHKLLKTQLLLPAGNLRESFMGYRRAQAIMVTKSPDLIKEADKATCIDRFDKETQNLISFSKLAYDTLKHFHRNKALVLETLDSDTVVYLLTGIANPHPLRGYLHKFITTIKDFEYPDHHSYSIKEIQQLVAVFTKDSTPRKIIVTTEKDVQRLSEAPLKALLLELPLYYLPVKIELLAEDKLTFDQKILNYVSIATRDRTIH